MRTLDRGPRVVRGPVFRTRLATIYDRPDEPVPIYIAAGAPRASRGSAPPATASSRRAASRASSTSTASCRRSPRARPRRAAARPTWTSPDGDQGLVRADARGGARGVPLLGAALPARRAEAGRRGSRRARAPRGRPVGRRHEALHLHDRPRGVRRAHPRVRQSRVPAPRLPLPGRRPGRLHLDCFTRDVAPLLRARAG